MKREKIKHNDVEIIEMAEFIIDHCKENIATAEANGNGNIDIIKFKPNDKHDYEAEYEKMDSRLRFIFNSYVTHMYRKYKYITVVTCVNRTQEEQDYIYMHHPDPEVVKRYLEKPQTSVHQVQRGLDFRDENMTDEMKKDTARFFHQVVYTGPRKTYLRHSVGQGGHWHLQTDSDLFTEIRRVY